MYRRRLFMYAGALSGGILVAYTAFEKGEPVKAFALLACSFIAFLFVSNDSDINMSESEPGEGAVMFRRLAAAVLCGFITFTLSFLMLKPPQESEVAGVTRIHGTVLSVSMNDERCRFVIRPEPDNDEENRLFMTGPLHHKAVCDYYFDDPSVLPPLYEMTGREITLDGKLKLPDFQRNPGCFDYRLYLKTKGIIFRFSADSFELSEKPAPVWWTLKRYLLKCRNEFLDMFEDRDVRAFMNGVVFGDKSGLSDDTYDDFKENGTAHILAVSGLHVGFILSMLKYLTKTRRTVGVRIGIIIIMVLYGEMTMWNASTVRSVIVMVTGLLAFHLERRFDLLSSVSAAAIVMLLARPYFLFNSGFIMSFLAVTGIAAAGRTLVPFLDETMSFLFSVQIYVAPYTAFAFNTFNPATLLINIPVVYLASVLVPVSLITIFSGIVTGIYLKPLIWIITALSGIIVSINGFLNFDGTLSADVTSVNAGTLTGMYLFFTFLFSEFMRVNVIRKNKRGILKCAAAVMSVCCMLSLVFADPFRNDEVVFIDVGQGDAVHVRCGGTDVLFDGGGEYDRNVGERILKPYLLKGGVRDLDASVLSHLHMDHCKGVTELSSSYPVKRTYLSRIYAHYDKLPANAIFLSCGDRVEISPGVICEVLWPVDDDPGGMTSAELDENEYNMVVMLTYGEVKIMITGDLLAEDEQKMVEYYKGTGKLKCDILKVAHHGSKTSSTGEFLDAADPKAAVIQAGKNNMYGHPHAQTLGNLEERGITVFRTDLCGAVGIDIRGSSFTVDVMNKDGLS